MPQRKSATAPTSAPSDEAPPPPKLIDEAVKSTYKAVSAADLKGGLVELPSGLVVKIRRAQPLALAAAGKIPNPLIATAIKVADDGAVLTDAELEEIPEGEREGRRIEAQIEEERLISAVVCAVVVEPKIVLTEAEEEEDSVWVGSLSPVDKRIIYIYAQAPQSEWTRFRKQFGGDAV